MNFNAKKIIVRTLLIILVAFQLCSIVYSQVPLKIINGLPYLDATVNGKGPFLFGFDTGFGGAVELDSVLAIELGLKPTGSIEIGDPSGRHNVTLATGTLKKLQIGKDDFDNLEVMFRAGRRAQSSAAGAVGILGMSVFAAHTFTIDYPASQLQWSKSALPAPDNKTTLSYSPVGGGVPEIEIAVGNEKIKAVVDSRSTSGVFKLPETLVKKMNMIGEPKLVGKGRTISNEIMIYTVKLKEPIRMGSFVYNEPSITYPSFIENQAVIGAQILKDYAISIDQKNRRISFIKTAIEKPSVTIVSASGKLKEYAETYGEREVSLVDGALHIQRPGGMLLKMIAKADDEFTLERVPQAILKFERDGGKKVTALRVFNPQNNTWETVSRSK
jgi:hypothetical protein